MSAIAFHKTIVLFIIALLPLVSLYSDPWGKDADLASAQHACPWKYSTPPPNRCPTPLVGMFAELLISFHQNIISPADGPRSHFLPSSSQYTLEAMRKYGFVNGFMLGCDRLMRENNETWVYKKGHNAAGEFMKLDPVP